MANIKLEHLQELLQSLQKQQQQTHTNSTSTSIENESNPHKRQKLINQPSTSSTSTLKHHHQAQQDHPNQQPTTQPILNFDQALTTLQKTIELQPGFLDKIQQIKEDQDQFELRSIDQRNQIQAELDRKLKKLINSSSPDNSSSSSSTTTTTKIQNEARTENLKIEYESKLDLFDRSVLSKWDQLKLSQSITLQNLNVPFFSGESDQSDPKMITQQNLVINFLMNSINECPSE
ncbi:hypothetical protein PGT21_007200 [Puccinia graminis f. sp. tritici]|uniref:Uncharacterized protein n=1 Tax=Puccinia graminis f. sp. tritici TaxID=56615 RepID=A0A5B0MD61_PUCGR|nr:hypothetical protein PGTUg99_027723 [Puccinia graminis f. sp. tritici]KAA1090619.1 hypothetical protein PGT21_007200 [Puccinia graminis f. sp. tritici]